jgi:hypothetical protein
MSLREDYWRLYLSPKLTEYIEFAKADVVHYQRLVQSQEMGVE